MTDSIVSSKRNSCLFLINKRDNKVLPVDLRSDTVTQPSQEMRDAMCRAVVGDDVLGDDPTVNQLQDYMAHLLGCEQAVYVPSGTMANGIAIRAHTEPGDEIISHLHSHYYEYESGAFAAVSGCSARFVDGDRGHYTAESLAAVIRPRNDHFAHARLAIIENTSNRGGGSVWPLEQFRSVCEEAHSHGLKIHLDGARLMNACVATCLQPTDYTQYVDSVSLCFSKGLGAPVGSVLAGSKHIIARGKRFRKMFGGTMRQSGIVAAAALYAITHNIDRLAEDHTNAKQLAFGLNELSHVTIDPESVETNMLYIDVNPDWGTGQQLADALEAEGVRLFATGPQRLRAVTHLDVNADQVDVAIDIFKRVLDRQ